MSGVARIGIFGGTFNPPHLAHVMAAEAFSSAISPDKLLIIPDYVPPHKEYSGSVTPEQRLEMCELAFGHIPSCEISDIEIKRGGRSYTYLTLQELSQDNAELYFLCGTDMFLTLDEWYHPEIIFELATICYIRREDSRDFDSKIKEKCEKYAKEFNARIIPVPTKAYELSSSSVREAFASGNAKKNVPAAVYEYIKKEGLYI